MGKLTVNENRNGFLKDGKPFFYLADTVWSAFTNITMDEWKYYLKKRREQGFNVLQINTMPQWDRCMSDTGLYPFATEDGQKFDFTKPDAAFYENARRMCEEAVREGFTPALVVLWLNFVPDTWGSKITDINVMPKELVQPYTERIVETFDEFDPVYFVSGDTDFETEEAVSYYRTALDVLRKKSPDSLKTCHIRRGYDVIPDELADGLDFYVFQSGHNRDAQDMAYILPQKLQEKYAKKPLVNAEPCYEQMGYSRNLYGRFTAEDIRKAAWHSILSGASAGVTYGAHGIWNWMKTGKPANPMLGEGFDTAFTCQQALEFPGAWDYGFIRDYMEQKCITQLIPAQQLVLNKSPEIRAAHTPDKKLYLIYIPRVTKIVLDTKFEDAAVRVYDLDGRRTARCGLSVQNGHTVVDMHPFQKDALMEITVTI